MEDHRSVVIVPPNLSTLSELARRVHISADICFIAIREIQGYYEIRGNDATLLESGKRAPDPRLVAGRLRTLRERIPKLMDEANRLGKEFPL